MENLTVFDIAQNMEYSQMEREMHNSPLKCTTNDAKATSPGKADSPVKRDFNSPDKHHTRGPSSGENKPGFGSPSALRTKASASPSKNKFGSPSSPSKRTKPFGKPIEIIRSKLSLLLHT